MHCNTLKAVLLLVPLLIGCGRAPLLLPDDALVVLARGPDDHAQRVYVGTVVEQGSARATYRYERWVSGTGEDRTSTHVTHALDGTPVVLHRARHDSAYRLGRFESVHAQTGIRSTFEVRDDGRVDFTVHRGAQVRRRHEGPGDPVVVGPTLFGFIRAQRETLARGDMVPVRFATEDRTYRFELRLAERRVDRVVVKMVASDVFVRLGIQPVRIELDPATYEVMRYHGRVPVLLDGDPFDADIDYAYDRPFR